ncbi:MAG: radical SAM protein [Candidatus Abyssobacteria bacterium SURF_17]|uniref:Radical SAM protein n=1 Tax=Candidatus Abyssobacteria bacterium SURF_17 TaxID=2093361 RepID=A0A419ET50_9BACT|nr:MAG: radical SAM protein [Candidatus Abyssubacteria bacterium SURF_17]
MSKIIFVEPKAPGFHIFSKWLLPRLGTFMLGTILRDLGHEVKIYIEEAHKLDWNDMLSADLVGVSTITSTAPRAYAIADQVRESGIPVIMGGPHPTFLPDEALEHADFVVRGEGEDAIVELLDVLAGTRPKESVAGLSYWHDGKKIHNPDRGLCRDLDSHPSPDFSLLVNPGTGVRSFFKFNPLIPVLTSRGCPFACKFCSVTTMFGRKYRFRSTEKVLEDLRPYADKTIFFYDDNFTANKERTKTLLRRMLAEGLTPEWTAQVRVDVAKDEELLDLMKRTNCFAVYVGFESINPRTLELYSKGQTLDDIVESIKKFHEHNIRIHGMFVLGSDEDDVRIIRETAKFAKRVKIDTVQFMILTPIPGSEIFHQFMEQKKIFTYNWQFYDGHHVVFQPKNMVPIVLQKEAVRAMKKFFSRMQVLKRVFRGDWQGAIVKGYGNRLIKQWERINKDFYYQLKHELYEELNTQISRLTEKFRQSEFGKLDRRHQPRPPVQPI